MNYFELFDIPVQLKVNRQELAPRFFELSRQFHPDYHAGSSEAVQQEMLERSALLNKAWHTFRSTDETIRYVLQQKGLLEEEEKYQLTPGFLAEVMDINEALMDLEPGNLPALEQLKAAIKELAASVYEPVKEIIEHYSDSSATEEQLLQVKDYYFQKKYLDRIGRELAGKG